MTNRRTVFWGAALFAAVTLCNGQGVGERIEQVISGVLPAWREGTGVYVEVGGRYVATGDGSIVLRMADEKSPLTLVWDSAGNWQLLSPRALPRDFEAQATPGGQTAIWRLRLRGLDKPLQRAQLAVLNAGAWEIVQEKETPLLGVQNWIDGGGVLTVGLSGSVEMTDASVRVIREGSLFLVR